VGNNIEIDLKETWYEGLERVWPTQDKYQWRFCGDGKEHSVSVKDGEFLDQPSDCQFLKKGCSLRSYYVQG
jgi:hypothetical protein